jgi:hypothetical protein
MVAVEEGLHGAVQQGQHPARIHRGTRAAQQVVARDDNFGFRGRRMLHWREQSHRAAGAQNRSASETLLQEIPSTRTTLYAHSASPLRAQPSIRIGLRKHRTQLLPMQRCREQATNIIGINQIAIISTLCNSHR